MSGPLYRSPQQSVIGGVCGGIAEYFGVNPTIVRVLAVISIFFTGGVSLTFYLLAMALLPMDHS